MGYLWLIKNSLQEYIRRQQMKKIKGDKNEFG
jgi:hypothetical protein